MTGPSTEAVRTDERELTPAQQALLVAATLAAAAEGSVQQGVRAYLAGRMSRVDLCYFAGQQVLQGVSQASKAGQRLAEVEWNVRTRPKVVSSAEHERIVKAFDTISRDAQKAQADDLAAVLKKVSQVSETSDTLTMRTTRIARAEVIKAGRVGYAGAVAQAIGDDPDFVWRYETDANPCGRCVELARKTFQSFEFAPTAGGHPSCSCTLTANYRED